MPPKVKAKPKAKKPKARVAQKQKQKQTVIVNIAGDLVKKKRVYKRKPKAQSTTQYPPPPPDTGFARVIYPVNNLNTDNITFQLNSVSKQLNDMQEKSLNRTANLMAGIRADERQKESAQLGEPESDITPIGQQMVEDLPLKIPERGRSKTERKKKVIKSRGQEASKSGAVASYFSTTADKTQPKLSPAQPLAPLAPLGAGGGKAAAEELSASPSTSTTPSKRRPRSDKGKPRGQLVRTASIEAAKRGGSLVTLMGSPESIRGSGGGGGGEKTPLKSKK